ncbi:MAG: T9SS type A sorting domain-containing protein [Chitinophagaceae bacterium]
MGLGQLPSAPYTEQYSGSPNFVYTDNVCTEHFTPSSNFPIDGTITFRSNTDGGISSLIVQLTDPLGGIIKTDAYKDFQGFDLVPTACAYNSVTQQYVVCGNSSLNTGNAANSIWYGIFDQDLNLFGGQFFYNEYLCTNIANQTQQYSLVTDIAPVIYKPASTNSPLIAFVMTGIVSDLPLNQPGGDRRIFIIELDGWGGIGMGHEYDISSNYINPGISNTMYAYPSRIIEVRNTSNPFYATGSLYCISGSAEGGDIGTGGITKGIFSLLTENNFNITTQQIEGYQSDGADKLYIGDIRYDMDLDEILLMGSYVETITPPNSNRGFFIDKIDNFQSSSTINFHSMTALSNNLPKISFSLPWYQEGVPRGGKIGTHILSNQRCDIAGYIQENPNFNQTYKLPLLFNVDYANSALQNWNTSGFTTCYYYPRIQISGVGNNYYPLHYYATPWYPDHTCHEYSNQTGFMYLGGLSNNGAAFDDYVGIQTINYNNNCLFGSDLLQNTMNPIVDLDMQILANPNLGSSLTVFSCGAGMNGININQTNCQFSPFKLSIFDTDYSINQNEHTLSIHNTINNEICCMYNFAGQLIQKKMATSLHNTQFDISGLSAGLYIVSVYNSNDGQLKYTQKVSIQ